MRGRARAEQEKKLRANYKMCNIESSKMTNHSLKLIKNHIDERFKLVVILTHMAEINEVFEEINFYT